MTDELVAYLLDDLPADRRAEVERRLASDFLWQRELVRLQDCMAAGDEPANGPEEPPANLVERTCLLVERVDAGQLPQTSHATPRKLASAAVEPPGGGRSRLVDYAVAAGVMLVLSTLALPSLRTTRDLSRRLTCENNLRWLGTELFNYQERRGHKLPQVRPGENAGIFAIELADRGGVDRTELAQHLVCPESPLADDVSDGRVILDIPSRKELQDARGEARVRMIKFSGGSYAYRLGHYDHHGDYHPLTYTGVQQSPLLADAPSMSLPGSRSANHHGGGQFVLDQSLCVCFRTDEVMPATNDNIFLNDDGKHAAGCVPNDVVLGRSEYGPDGLVTPVSLQK